MANTYQLTQTGPQVQADLDAVEAGDIVYLTSAPSADNTSGKLKIVVLDVEPSTKYEGYIYIVKATPGPGITDLTGTKWLFNDIVNIEGHGGSWNIIFNSGGRLNDGMYVGTGIPATYVIDYNTNGNDYTAYYDNAWSNEAYRTIAITGGTDTTNSDFIAWLQANATQVPVNQVSLISFTIVGTTYQAEEGMTWTEWCNSEYNTSGCYISGDSVVKDGGTTTIIAAPNDVIVANNAYTSIHSGGGSND